MLHEPVLLTASLDALQLKPDGYYVDATFGRGGHSSAILKRLGPKGKLLVLDQDLTAIQYAEELFAQDSRVIIKHANFNKLAACLIEQQLNGEIDGVLLDLGVSSPQLSDPERGFSFLLEGPLDMRMDQSVGISASKWLAKINEFDLAKVLFEYGEEYFSRKLARAIVAYRKHTPITTTTQLAELIREHHPRWPKHKHPATKSFQAIRIAINQELTSLEQVLAQAVAGLKLGGRLAVISFHSLEDRIVKRFIAQHSQLNKIYKTKPDADEITRNPRARSAMLRVAEKI